MTVPSPEDIARALHAPTGYTAEVEGAARPLCLCGAQLPMIANTIADGDAEAAAALVHGMHVDDVLAELRGGRVFGDRPSLDAFT